MKLFIENDGCEISNKLYIEKNEKQTIHPKNNILLVSSEAGRGGGGGWE